MLLQLGGKLDTFLSKKVNFIVSNASQNVKSMPSKKPIHQSRAMNMVLKSPKKAVKGSSYKAEIAKRWKIKTLYYEEFCQEIKPLIEQRKAKLYDTEDDTSLKNVDIRVKTLKSPFIKFEDKSGLYRPCYKEFKKISNH